MHSGSNTPLKTLTILLPGGSLPFNVLAKVNKLSARYKFELYLSTAQNLRLYNIPENDLESIKDELVSMGVKLKGPGLFPTPRVCIGNLSCKLGIIDTISFSRKIMSRFGEMTDVKPKFKVALAGCPANCSNAVLTDIGIVATRQGFDIYLGGKGGSRPRTGIRVVRGGDEEKVLTVIGEVVDFHNRNTEKKKRIYKHLEDASFPYREEI